MRGEHGTSEPASDYRETVPRNRLRAGLIATTIAALTLALAGCTDDPAPVGTLPDGSPVASASAQATPEPTRPVEEATPESAIEFTRYFWDLYNYAYQTYDTAPLKAISDPTCSFCDAVIEDITKTDEARTKITGYQLILTEATSPPVKISSGTLVVGVLSQKPGRATAPDASFTELPGFKSVRSTVALVWRVGSWHIEGITNDPKSRKAWGA